MFRKTVTTLSALLALVLVILSMPGITVPAAAMPWWLPVPATLLRAQIAECTEDDRWHVADAITLDVPDSSYVRFGLIDSARQYAYFGLANYQGSAGRIVRINLTTFTQDGTLALAVGDVVSGGAVDQRDGTAYFNVRVGEESSKILKVNPQFSLAGTLALPIRPAGMSANLQDSAAIDTARNMGYFTLGYETVRVNLASFAEIDRVPPVRAGYDFSAGLAYSPGSMPISLPDFTVIKGRFPPSLGGNSEEGPNAIDSARGFLYVSQRVAGKILQIDLRTMASTHLRQSMLLRIDAISVDPDTGDIYVSQEMLGMRSSLARLRASDFAWMGSLPLDASPSQAQQQTHAPVFAVLDPGRRMAYVGHGFAEGGEGHSGMRVKTKVTRVVLGRPECQGDPVEPSTPYDFREVTPLPAMSPVPECWGADPRGISRDGRLVAFGADFDSLAGRVGANGGHFLKDRQTGALTKINLPTPNGFGSNVVTSGFLSPDGGTFVYRTGPPLGSNWRLLVREGDSTQEIPTESLASLENEILRENLGYQPGTSISVDGRYVKFPWQLHAASAQIVYDRRTPAGQPAFSVAKAPLHLITDRSQGGYSQIVHFSDNTILYRDSATGAFGVPDNGVLMSLNEELTVVRPTTTLDITIVEGLRRKQRVIGQGNYPSISDDGRFVVFTDINQKTVIYDRRWRSQRSIPCTNGVISGNGQFILCRATQALVAQDTNGKPDAYVYERARGTFALASSGPQGQLGRCSWDDSPPSNVTALPDSGPFPVNCEDPDLWDITHAGAVTETFASGPPRVWGDRCPSLNSQTIIERTCSDLGAQEQSLPCPNGFLCVTENASMNGTSVPSAFCIPVTAPSTSACSDTDGGVAPQHHGQISGNNASFIQDTCGYRDAPQPRSIEVNEYYCANGGTYRDIPVPCPMGTACDDRVGGVCERPRPELTLPATTTMSVPFVLHATLPPEEGDPIVAVFYCREGDVCLPSSASFTDSPSWTQAAVAAGSHSFYVIALHRSGRVNHSLSIPLTVQ